MQRLLVIAFLLVSGAPPGARESAAHHYQTGFDLAGRKQWIEALAEYRQAIAIVESELPESEQRRILPAIRYEVGLAAEHITGGTAIAVAAFERYLEDPPEKPNPQAKAHATRFVARFANEVGRIDLRGPAEAKAAIDGEPVGTLPLRHPAVVMPGDHTISVSASGFTPNPAKMNALVAAGATVLVDAGALLSPVVEAKPEPAPTSTVAELRPGGACDEGASGPVPAYCAGKDARRDPPPPVLEEKRPEPRPRSIAWPWLAGGVGAIAIGVVVDTAPSSANDGKLEATDFLPLLFYLAGSACIGWFAWNLIGQDE